MSCTDEDLAPAGCLTYDTETSGTLKSWNYQVQDAMVVKELSGQKGRIQSCRFFRIFTYIRMMGYLRLGYEGVNECPAGLEY